MPPRDPASPRNRPGAGPGNAHSQEERGHAGRVLNAAFDHDGGRVASVSLDRALRVWDTATGRAVSSWVPSPNESYAVAKIAGIKLCQAYRRQYGCHFIAAMPTNLYGPGDNFDLENSHVLAALIRKFNDAKMRGAPTVEVWGSGAPLREFCHVDDCADGCLFLMENYDDAEIINIGHGKDISIRDLALLIKDVVGFAGNIVFDTSKPDGTPRKLVDCTRIFALGWRPTISLRDGIRATYAWFESHAATRRSRVGRAPGS